jgi:hypothetical protein
MCAPRYPSAFKGTSAPAVAPRRHTLDVSFGSCGRVTRYQGSTPFLDEK